MIWKAARRRGAHRARHRERGVGAVRLLPAAARAVHVLLVVAAMAAATVLVWAGVGWAQPEAPTDPGVDSIPEVVDNMRIWLVGILVAVSTLFLTVGGFRYLWANGDPGEVDKAKSAMRNAAIGYALAILAPLFVTIVNGFVS